MAPEVAGALTGLLTALTALVWAEVRYRAARRRSELLARRVSDVQHKVGADRRAGDADDTPAGQDADA